MAFSNSTVLAAFFAAMSIDPSNQGRLVTALCKNMPRSDILVTTYHTV
jgi:hypothetical protein